MGSLPSGIKRIRRRTKQMDTDRNGTIDHTEFMESARAFKTKKDGL